MTKEEAKKIIKSRCYFASVLPDTKEALDMAIKALSSEPQEWISVGDKLPNEDCECWLTLEYTKTSNRVLYESHYDPVLVRFYNQRYLERRGYKLIAWQKKRMPSPYKGE